MSIEMTASLFCSYANEEKPVRRVSRRKDEEGCGTREGCRHGGGCGCCGEGSLPRSNYAAHAGRASPHRASLSYFKDTCAQGILLVELCERDSENIGGR